LAVNDFLEILKESGKIPRKKMQVLMELHRE
jgi:hypothetical protein